MIRFFKFVGPIQLGIIFILPFLFRIPFFFFDSPLLAEDLKHFVVGEKLNEGFMLYRDLIDDTSPISGIIYWFFELVFGRSIFVYTFFSCLLIGIQAILFVMLCAKHELLSQKTAFCGLVYVVTANICYDFLSFSPALISVTFILLSLDTIFKQIKSERGDTDFYTSGLFLGLAYLTFPPNLVFLFVLTFILILFSRTSINNYLVFGSGFLFPILMVFCYFFWFNGLEAFAKCYVFNINFTNYIKTPMNLDIAMLILIPTATICLLGVLRSLNYRRFINYQVVCQRALLIILIFIGAFLLLFYSNKVQSFVVLLPFISFFNTHFFQLIIRKKEIGDYVLVLYLLFCFSIIYSFLPIDFLKNDSINFNHQVVFADELNKKIIGKKVAVLGENKSLLLNNKLAGPYLDWSLSKSILEKSDEYSYILKINTAFNKDLPQIIVDSDEFIPKIFKRLPAVNEKYKLIEPNIYQKL